MTDARGADWAEMPAAGSPTSAGSGRPGSGRARTWLRPFVGPALLVGMAVALGLTHHNRRATAVGVAAVVLTLLLLVSRRFREGLDGGVRRAVPVMAAVLGCLLLAPVYFLVLTPLGGLLRAFGSPPLDVGRDAGRSSYWSARRNGKVARPERLFADERGWSSVGFSPRQGRRLVLRTVAAVLLIEALVAGGFAVVERRRTAPAALAGVSATTATEAPALAGIDWLDDARAEQAEVVGGLVYTPFTGASLHDYEGRYFNVRDRVRASYRPPDVPGRHPVEVWFFGGSTMFGFDVQRDAHTIPSEVVRLAEGRGITVVARNYGMAGYVNYQESVLLSLLATAEQKPDLVVFYDGTNDRALALLNVIDEFNPEGEPGELGALVQRRALAGDGEVRNATADPPAPLGIGPGPRPMTAEGLVDDTVGVYGQGVDLSRTLADRYGFQVVHFWQPDMFSKQPLDEGELALHPDLALDRFRYEAMAGLSASVRRALPDGVIDISNALDDVDGPVLTDTVHTNEKGARAVAEAMFGHLEPDLVRLSAGG